jgi:hypothetical protein
MDMSFNHSKYQYVVIPKNCPTPQALELYHVIYESWLKLWRDVFSDGDRTFEPSVDDFLKQDYIAAIFESANLVGFHLSSTYDLRKKMLRNQSYFADFSPQSFEEMKKYDLNKVMSIEYLSVMPSYRKARNSTSWAAILISLAQKLMCESSADSLIGTARTDVKVDVISKKLGFFEIQKPIEKYDYSCAVIICPKSKIVPSPSFEEQSIVTQLWETKINFIQENSKNAQVA